MPVEILPSKDMSRKTIVVLLAMCVCIGGCDKPAEPEPAQPAVEAEPEVKDVQAEVAPAEAAAMST